MLIQGCAGWRVAEPGSDPRQSGSSAHVLSPSSLLSSYLSELPFARVYEGGGRLTQPSPYQGLEKQVDYYAAKC